MKKTLISMWLSLMIAVITSLFMFVEGNMILKYLIRQTNYKLLLIVSIMSGVLMYIFIHKKIEKKSILFLQYIISIVVSFFVIFLIGFVLGVCLYFNLFDSILSVEIITILNSSIGSLYINFLFTTYTIIVIVFGVTLFLISKRKIQYIDYISKEIKVMEQRGLDHELIVKGDDELAELTKTINNMANTLYIKEKKERELITNISHDLRNPMTSILGYVDLLKRNGLDDSYKFWEYIEVVDRRLHNLKDMIDELFELSKLTENGSKLNLQEQDIIILLKQLVQENKLVFENNGLKLETSLPNEAVFIVIDPEKIARAMQNLLDNAKKYAIKNTIVSLNVEIYENKTVISILNQLDNVQSINTDLLFERFYKADEARSYSESSGLGLAIVKRIVQLHGGEVDVQIIDDNICFSLFLPLVNTNNS